MNTDELFAQANRHIQSGDLNAANRIYQQILGVLPDNLRALHALGVVEFRLSNPEQAIELIERALSIDPDFSTAWQSLGIICEQCGMLIEAKEAFSKAANLAHDVFGEGGGRDVVFDQFCNLDDMKQYLLAPLDLFSERHTLVEKVFVPSHLDVTPVQLDSSITIGVAAYGNWQGTLETLRSIFMSAVGDFELILIDDCSPDDTLTLFRQVVMERPGTRVFHFPRNLEYSHSVNAILSQACGDLILFLSNDIIVTPNYLRELVHVARSSSDIGLVRGVSNYVDNGLTSHNVPFYGDPKCYDDVNHIADEIYNRFKGELLDDPFLTGDAFLATRDLIRRIGTFDTLFVGYFSDHDFGLRARIAGFKTVLACGAFAFHNHGANITSLDPEQQAAKIVTRRSRINAAWREFKKKYGLPYYRPYINILTSIPWKQLALVVYDPERHYVSPQDYSAFEATSHQGANVFECQELSEGKLTALFDQASVLVNENRFLAAGELYQIILQRAPDNHRALHALGVVTHRGGSKSTEAITFIKRALELKPDFYDAWYNLGNVFCDLGQWSEAQQAYYNVLQLSPHYYRAWQGLGNVFFRMERFEESIECYRKADEISPEPIVQVQIGTALKMLGRLEEAAAAFRSALKLKEECGEAYYGLAMVYEAGANLAVAREYVQKALHLIPDSSAAMQLLAGILLAAGTPDEAVAWYRRAIDAGGGGLACSNMLFAMNSSPHCTQEEIFANSCRWEKVAQLQAEACYFPPRSPGRLRIGYVSPDFRQHSVAFFLEPLLKSHNRSRFEIYCYSNVPAPDRTTGRLKELADHWQIVRHLSDQEAAELIRRDRIDILIDLAGHTADNRLGIFARRGAPVQVTWLGYPNTTGVSAIDFRITDGVADPIGICDQLHSETLLRLPDGFLCYRPPDEAPHCSLPPYTANGYVTFGSFNNTSKITDDVIDAWCRILRALPESRLLLKSKALCDPEAAQRFTDRFCKHGIAPERIKCVPATTTIANHLLLYSRIDIALDPFPYNGTTTTLEALYMGVPVVTVRGDRHAGRVGASILTLLGRPELVAESVSQYIELTVSLAHDLPRLSAYREVLREQLVLSVLTDAIRFTDNFEEACRAAWRSTCHPPPISPPTLDDAFEQARILATHGDYRTAREVFETILVEAPENPRALHGVGVSAYMLGDSETAIWYISKALKRQPVYLTALTSLGNICQETGRIRESLDFFRKALALDPGYTEIHSNLVMNLQYLPDVQREDILAESKKWAEQHARCTRRCNPSDGALDDRCHKVRVGFVSADFKKHPVGYMILPLFTHYDRENFEFICYNNGGTSDEVTERIVVLVDQIKTIESLSDLEAWQLINDDKIDVLVDLSGHTAGNRLVLFSMLPAPIQISWLGYFDTTGLESIQYLVMDRYVSPPEDKSYYTEQIVYLPDSRFCYAPPDYMPEISGLPSLAAGHITFGSFNNIAKLNDQVIALWADILKAVPGSRLLLKWRTLSDEAVCGRIKGLFKEYGIDSVGRIEFRGQSGHLAMLEEYSEVDIALDPFPFSGGLTSLESLMMGVPVITLAGSRPVSRQTASFLELLDLGDLVATTTDHYRVLAVALANNTERLSLLRSTLRTSLLESPLCDGVAFSRNICGLFTQISLTRDESEAIAQWEKRCDVASAFLDSGDIQESEHCFEEIVAESGGYPRALHGLGVIRFRLGRHEDGVALLRKALEHRSDYADAWRNLGKMLHDIGNYLESAECCQKVSSLCPEDQNSPPLEAAMLVKAGRSEQAILVLERFVTKYPNHFDAVYTLAQLLQKNRLYSSADRYLLQALHLAPDHASVLISLGNLCLSKREFDAAEDYYRTAITVCPTSAEAYTNLGHLYTECKRFKEALEFCSRAVELKPEFALGWVNLACALEKSGRLTDAVAAYSAALEHDADYYQARSSLIMLLNYLPGTSLEEIYRQSRIWNDRHAAPLTASSLFVHSKRSPGNTLRVGFVSPDFHRHPVGYFVHPFFLLYDRNRFEVFCYSDVMIEDGMTEDLRDAVDQWRDVRALDDDSLANLIHEDGIDILVDLAGHTSGNRLRVFAMKPAPVQVTWAGYVGTTGLDAMDFLISDQYQSPPGTESYTSEQIVRMPNDYVCYCPPDFCGEVTSLPAHVNGSITFGVFNNLAKVSPVAIQLWSETLKHVPGSRLFIKNPSFDDRDVIEQYLKLFEAHGIDRSRISTAGQSPPAEMMGSYAKVDIQLDTTPYSGGLTTIESLWMGVPVVTLPNELFSSRHSCTHLINVGLSELVATSCDHYRAIACDLASNLDRLAEIRSTLRQRVLDSPLCDGFAFTEALQRAFAFMWNTVGMVATEPDGGAEARAFQTTGPEVLSPDEDTVDIDNIITTIRFNAARHVESGRELLAAGRFDEAERELSDALELDSELPDALCFIARIYQRRGEFQKSRDSLLQALELDPLNVDALADVSAVLTAMGYPTDGELRSRRALELCPGHPNAYCSLGIALSQQGRMEEAVEVLREGTAQNPENPVVHSKWIFSMHYSTCFTVEEIYAVSKLWDHHFGRTTSLLNAVLTLQSKGDDRITVGYISPDFGMHPVGYFLKGLISSHDKSKFRVIGYSDRLNEDPLSLFLKDQCDAWRVVAGVKDETVVQIIVNDGVDILIDLAGHTANNRLTLFAMKPAPVQITWGGYVGTTGLSTMDYLISDWWESPEGTDTLCSEKILRLPVCYVTYSPPDYAPSVKERATNTVRSRTMLGCFNNISKLNEDVVALWAEIMLEMPTLDLFLKTNAFTDTKVMRRYIRLFSDRGVDPERLAIEGGGTHQSMLESYLKVDIALDPFPYSGGLTTLEALWMGVPVITLPGRSFASRHSLSHLQAVGLPELVAESKDHYKLLVLALARDPERIYSYRSSLRNRMRNSSLFQYDAYTRAFESVLLQTMS